MRDHIPVLLHEVLEYLDPKPGQTFIDGTFGRGGHARAILERLKPNGRLFVFDLDPTALAGATSLGESVTPIQANFRFIEREVTYAAPNLIGNINGILLDLGISSTQLADPELGLSFQESSPLNMRLSRDQGLTAAEIVNTWPEEKIASLIKTYGEEPRAKSIAAAIVKERRDKPLTTTLDLAALISRVVRGARQRIHPATKTFQALRMAVNDEMENLREALDSAIRLLAPQGRLAVISFHSLEDRLVKQTLRAASQSICTCPEPVLRCTCERRTVGRLITKHVVIPSESEIKTNFRSRSAKLRVFEKN